MMIVEIKSHFPGTMMKLIRNIWFKDPNALSTGMPAVLRNLFVAFVRVCSVNAYPY